MNIRLLLSAVVSSACLALVAPSGASAQALEHLRMTIPVATMNYYPIFVARDLGYFKDEGLEMQVITTQGDGPDVDALIAGSVEFTATTPNRLLTAYQGGKPLLGILSLTNRIAINCFLNKERAQQIGVTEETPIAEKFAKLKGLVIGGTRPGAFTYLLGIDYLQRAGLVPQKDARVIGVGGGPSMLAALEHKQIDVGCLASPTPEIAVNRGSAIMLVNNTRGQDPEFSEFLFSLLYVRPDYAKEHADTVRKVTKALVRAMKYVVSTPFEQQKAMLKHDFGDIDDKVLQECLKNTQAAIEPSGRISQRSVEAAEKFLISTKMLSKEIPWNAVIDNGYLPR